MVQDTLVAGTQHLRQLVRAARRKAADHPDGGVRPVAFATAAISMPDFVPSRNELNICGFIPPMRACFLGQSVIAPYRRRCGRVIFRQVLRALSGGEHAEAAGTRPVHQLADQRGLVAVGQRIHHTGALRLARQRDAGQHIGLDVDHHDVLALGDRAARMRDAGGRVAGRFHHNLDVRRLQHRQSRHR